MKLGGANDPEEHEAEHAAKVVASGGCYGVIDPGGSSHLRAASAGDAHPQESVRKTAADHAAHEPARRMTAPAAHETTRALAPDAGAHPAIRAAVATPVLDPGASGRVRRTVAPPILDPGASGRIRSAAATPGVSHDATQKIERARAATTRPLPPAVQGRLERGFGQRMDNVGLHTGPMARAAARAIGARAYTEGERITLGPGESEHDLHLMAHEATHVVQNRRAAGVFRALPADAAARRAPQGEAHKAELNKAEAPKAETRRLEAGQSQPIRRLGLDTVLDKIADWANVIPGFRLFTIVLGMNPINREPVDRSGANILRAAVEIIPLGGLIVKALDTYGIFEKAGVWLDQEIAKLGMIGSAIYHGLMDFLDSLGLSDIIHPGDVWDRAKHIFTDPIDRLLAFFKEVGAGIVELIKTVILKPLAALASKTPAWDLLCAILGKNPITGEPVESSAEALVGGILKLAGQQEIWEKIQKAHALQRIWAWFQKAMKELVGFVREVPGLFITAVKSFVIQDLLDLPGALARVVGMFADFVGKFITWGLDTAWTLLEIVFDVVSPGALSYVKKTGAALKSILKNPLPFVSNLAKSAKAGFENFATHIGEHLKAGLINWLTGSLPGVYIPKAFEFGEIVKFVFSVLSLSWQAIRAKLVKAVGEPAVKAMETGFDIVVTLVTKGPAAAWEKIKEQIGNLQDMVVGGITDFVIDTVKMKAVPKLIALFIPGAGFISAILSIYDIVMVFVHKIATIAEAVTAFVNSIGNIAAGAVAAAAAKVETVFAKLLTLAINFLAGFAGIGKVADKIMGVIAKLRDPIDKALDWLVGWIVTSAKKLFAKAFGKDGKKDDAHDQRWNAAVAGVGAEVDAMPEEEKSEDGFRKRIAKWKSQYQFSELTVEHHEGELAIEGAMSAKKKVKIIRDNTAIVKELEGEKWIQIKRGAGWIVGSLDVVDKTKEEIRYTVVFPAAGIVKAAAHFMEYDKVVRKYQPGTEGYLSPEALAAANNTNVWGSYPLARKVLNYRANENNDQSRNPPGKQWHHIHEQSGNGPNTVTNIALTSNANNQTFNEWFGKLQYSVTLGGDIGHLEGTGQLSLRNYLKTVGEPELWKRWGLACLALHHVRVEAGAPADKGKWNQIPGDAS